MAGRLRINTDFGKRAVESESKEPKEVYVISIAGEGKTEERYFNGISNLNTNSVVKVEILKKSDTKSHPKHVLDLLNERKKRWEEYGIDPNELWMVVDRDKQSVSEEQLTEIIEECCKNRYNLALSNPTFEFWLLLHLKDIKDIKEYDKKKLLENEKINESKTSKRFIEKELSILLNGYNKKNLKFEKFKSGIKAAIERAKKLPTDNKALSHQLGTSVCLLVEKIVK